MAHIKPSLIILSLLSLNGYCFMVLYIGLYLGAKIYEIIGTYRLFIEFCLKNNNVIMQQKCNFSDAKRGV